MDEKGVKSSWIVFKNQKISTKMLTVPRTTPTVWPFPLDESTLDVNVAVVDFEYLYINVAYSFVH